MQEFSRKHEARIQGVLSCFDRMLFRGCLPIMSGWSMEPFLNGLEVNSSSLKPFLLENTERMKGHAIAMAKKYERPFQYLASPIRKEDTARKLAEGDGIEEGRERAKRILDRYLIQDAPGPVRTVPTTAQPQHLEAYRETARSATVP